MERKPKRSNFGLSPKKKSITPENAFTFWLLYLFCIK